VISTIGTLQVNIVATTDKLVKGLNSASAYLSKFANQTKYFSAGAALAVGGLFKWFDSVGSELHDLSEATGISVENLDFLKYAAEQSGTSLETLTKAARELINQGISPDRFEEIASKIAAIEDPVTRAQVAMARFGKRSALALLPMIRDLPALKKRFKELGGPFTQKMVDDADALGDSFGDLLRSVSKVAFAIADSLTPTVISLTDFITKHTGAVKEFVERHGTLVFIVVGATAALAAMSPVLYSLSVAVGVAAGAFKVLGAAMLFASANPYVAAIAAIAAAVVALVAVLEHFFGVWTKFKKTIGLGGDIATPGIQAGAAPHGATVAWEAGANAPAASNEVAKNTATTNDKLDELIMAMKARRAAETQQAQEQSPPVQLAIAGVR
jgi:hypothetical protein